MQIIGTVIQNLGTVSEVVIYRSSACGGDCGHNCAVCAAAKRIEVLAANGPLCPSAGSTVVLETGNGSLLGMAALVYLLPLATGVGGYLLTAGRGEDAALLAALLGFLLGFIPALVLNRRITKSGRPSHTIVSVEQP